MVNVAPRPSPAKATCVLPILAGPEIGVASTKAFTCQLTVLAALSLTIARQRGKLDAVEEARLGSVALCTVPGLISTALAQEPQMIEVARDLARARDVLFLGRGADVSARAGRRSEAEGNQLHPR